MVQLSNAVFFWTEKNTSNEICVRVIRFLLNWLINNSFCAKVCEVDQLLLRLRHLKCFRGLFLLLFLFSFVNYIFKLVHFIQQINDFHMIINMHISLLANSLNPKRIYDNTTGNQIILFVCFSHIYA